MRGDLDYIGNEGVVTAGRKLLATVSFRLVSIVGALKESSKTDQGRSRDVCVDAERWHMAGWAMSLQGWESRSWR